MTVKLIIDGLAVENMLHSPDGLIGRYMIGKSQVVQNAAIRDCPKRTGRLSESIVKRFYDSDEGFTVVIAALQPYALAPDLLWESVTQRLFTLPGETLLFSGHVSNANAVSTVFERRRWHPLFARLTRDEFIAQMARRLESKMGMGSNG